MVKGSLSNNVPRDPGSSKIKGISRISADSKTTGPNQLDAVSNKWWFDKSEHTPDARQPTCRWDPQSKLKSSILKPHLAISEILHKIELNFNSYPTQKGVHSTTKYIFVVPIVNLGLETIIQ